MAIFKAVSHGKSTSLANAVGYVLNTSKTHGMSVGFGCSPETALADMREVQRAWGKEDGTSFYHYVISFAPGEVNDWEALDIAQELVGRLSSLTGHQVLLSTHSDRDHVHVHMVVNAVSEQDGRKLQFGPRDLAEAKRVCNELTASRGLSVPQKGKTYDGQERDGVVSYRQDTYQRLEAAEDPQTATPSYVRDIGEAVVRAMTSATSREEFIAQLDAAGISTVWTEQRKHITFTDRARVAAGEKQCKIRLGTLGKYYNLPDTKEDLLHEFAANAERAEKAEREQSAAADGLACIRESAAMRRESEAARGESAAARGEREVEEPAPTSREDARESIEDAIDERLSETQVSAPSPDAEMMADTEIRTDEASKTEYSIAERIAAGIRAIAQWAAEAAERIRAAIDAGFARIRRQPGRETGRASGGRDSQAARTATERAASIARTLRDAIRDHWAHTRARSGAVRTAATGRAGVGAAELIEVPYDDLVAAGQSAVGTQSGMRRALLLMGLYPALRTANIYALIGAEDLNAVPRLTRIQHGAEVLVPDALAELPAAYTPTDTVHAQLQRVAGSYAANASSKYGAMYILAIATGESIPDSAIDQLVRAQIADPMTLEHANAMWRQAAYTDWQMYRARQRSNDWERS